MEYLVKLNTLISLLDSLITARVNRNIEVFLKEGSEFDDSQKLLETTSDILNKTHNLLMLYEYGIRFNEDTNDK